MTLIKLIVIFLPWKIRRIILNRFWKYEIHPKARIGFSYIYPKHLIMEEGANIGHLNVAIHLEMIHINLLVNQIQFIVDTMICLKMKSY